MVIIEFHEKRKCDGYVPLARYYNDTNPQEQVSHVLTSQVLSLMSHPIVFAIF